MLAIHHSVTQYLIPYFLSVIIIIACVKVKIEVSILAKDLSSSRFILDYSSDCRFNCIYDSKIQPVVTNYLLYLCSLHFPQSLLNVFDSYFVFAIVIVKYSSTVDHLFTMHSRITKTFIAYMVEDCILYFPRA
jgi:hypothetical protein